ncbi:hypothetical protein ACPXCE_18235 [Streptomyces sp. DT24]|uniref:hypothetical protein n=1 Tax=unclassified Streptomyces TaxID=2593676 RepID=UPI0023B91D99|nr:hypothetical protein [Streptomyces sp. AM 4-1-1]WEH32167.1 hypothetical protein PZB75_01510 [Streptomyces sp. AM 4-1-1]
MATPPIVISRPSPSGGRRVTVQRDGRVQILGLAHSDHDVIVFLATAGLDDPERVLDSPEWTEWRGGRAHRYEAA